MSNAIPSPRDSSRRVRLRPIIPNDYEYLYQLSVSPATNYRWRFRGTTPAPEKFAQDLWAGVVAQFMMVGTATGRPIGQVVAYNAQPENGLAYIGVLCDDDALGSGVALEGLGLFITYLFQHWPFRKLYAELPEFSFASVASGLEKVFVEEGLLKDYVFYAERYWDVHIIALSRTSWKDLAGRFEALLGGT